MISYHGWQRNQAARGPLYAAHLLHIDGTDLRLVFLNPKLIIIVTRSSIKYRINRLDSNHATNTHSTTSLYEIRYARKITKRKCKSWVNEWNLLRTDDMYIQRCMKAVMKSRTPFHSFAAALVNAHHPCVCSTRTTVYIQRYHLSLDVFFKSHYTLCSIESSKTKSNIAILDWKLNCVAIYWNYLKVTSSVVLLQ